MKLITKEIDRQLRTYGERSARGIDTSDARPALKLFNPCGAATWLISERDPENPDILFGLCDLGFGTPELGSLSLSEIESIRLPFGLKIERDIHWTPSATLSEYADKARKEGRIVA